MTHYMDMTNADGCFGVIPENGETIVFVGVSINSIPLSVKRREGDAYADFARKYGIHFIFDDDIPAVDFYTIPRVDIAAVDNEGGFIGSIGEPFTLSHAVPLVYISKGRRCYMITEDSTKLLSMASEWKERMVPYDGINIYDSKDAAREDYEIIDFEKTEEYQNMMKLINERKGQAKA